MSEVYRDGIGGMNTFLCFVQQCWPPDWRPSIRWTYRRNCANGGFVRALKQGRWLVTHILTATTSKSYMARMPLTRVRNMPLPPDISYAHLPRDTALVLYRVITPRMTSGNCSNTPRKTAGYSSSPSGMIEYQKTSS